MNQVIPQRNFTWKQLKNHFAWRFLGMINACSDGFRWWELATRVLSSTPAGTRQIWVLSTFGSTSVAHSSLNRKYVGIARESSSSLCPSRCSPRLLCMSERWRGFIWPWKAGGKLEMGTDINLNLIAWKLAFHAGPKRSFFQRAYSNGQASLACRSVHQDLRRAGSNVWKKLEIWK